ncbi:CD109 antigen-like isoform X1 [Anopheles darlingi]|uniref:CD109 antigen-like isoform X1 n=1 Tax=Anopheles darlingi TaxID=43151 RepID=UPI00210012B1|nr:CD109 antigen-like isoform X1 [Anopheles darlingi]
MLKNPNKRRVVRGSWNRNTQSRLNSAPTVGGDRSAMPLVSVQCAVKMCWLSSATICATLILASMAQGLIVVGPNTIYSNRNYTVTIFNTNNTRVTLAVNLKCFGADGIVTFDQTKSVDVVSKVLKKVEFKIPVDRFTLNGKITIDGNKNFFHKQSLEYEGKSISGFIQLSKPVYKPGDSVQFRVIVLDPDLKPPSGLKMITVTVQDPNGNNIRQWANAKLYNGVFEGQLDIAPSPLPGTYNIKVEANDEELVSKTFEVKEYVLSTFKMDVFPTVTPLEEHQALNLTIAASYYFGKPVIGRVKVQLYDVDNNLELSKEYDVNGMLQVHLPFTNPLILYGESQDVRLNVSFSEKYTNRTVFLEPHITVYKHNYQVKVIGDPVFYAASSNPIKLAVTYQDGNRAKGVSLEVKIEIEDGEHVYDYTSDQNGIIAVSTSKVSSSADEIDITVSYSERILLKETLSKTGPISYRLRITTPDAKLKPDKPFNLEVDCSHRMTFVLYYIVSKGNIVFSRSQRVEKKLSHNIQLPYEARIKVIPRANVIVATVIDNTFVYDNVIIGSEHLANNIHLKLRDDEYEIRPDHTIELLITGRPKSYVALASYDRSLLQHGKNHDISREDILKLFDEKKTFSASAPLGDIGLFVYGEHLRIEAVEDKSARSGIVPNNGLPGQLHPYRTDFLESWLWKNVTLSKNGTFKLIAPTPDTTTSWYLTGFSIDPVYGFGIIKKPLMITASLPFYIVDNLPYSIRRGESVALQFTLFNTFGTECNAIVTMYNTNDQFEILDNSSVPLAKFQTKSIEVPATGGVGISFLVKAKTLGEMKVRLMASTMQGREVDAIQKHVLILPENIQMNAIKSHFFWHKSHNSSYFKINQDIDRHAIPSSIETYISVIPNLVSQVNQALGTLLVAAKDTGDQNLMNFALCFVILKYEKTMGRDGGEVHTKAVKLLQTSYQSQLKFWQTDGSFGVWKHKGGSVFVTAFVSQWLIMAEHQLQVKENDISKAFDWLASKQQHSGAFIEDGPKVYNDMQSNNRNEIALTSFVMVAFIKMKKVKNQHQAIIEKGISYIADRLDSIENSFDLSIATYALYLNCHQKKDSALEKLITSSTTIEDTAQRFWNSSTSPIETAAFALLSLLEANRIGDGYNVIRWLVNQTYKTGTFHHSFDTAFGLLAIVKFNQLTSIEKNEYIINIFNSDVRQDFIVDGTQKAPSRILLNSTDAKTLNATVDGIGTGILQVKTKYETNLMNVRKQFYLTVQQLNSTSATVLKLRICSKFRQELTKEPSNLVRVEVNLPSGYVAHGNPISNATTVNTIHEINIRYSGTTVELYYEKMDATNNCFTTTAYRLFNVANRRPAYVVVQDVYNPKRTAIQLYEVEKQDICEICCHEDCPDSCKHYVGRIINTCASANKY